MKVSYGQDIAYIKLGQGKMEKTKEVAPGLLLDVDKDGQAIGLEVIGLAHRGLLQGMVEVELSKASEGNEEQRLSEALFGGQQPQTQAR
ncbi:MAG: DUF2283 domain-containing protein [Candidatus Dormibacteraceae bacterium]